MMCSFITKVLEKVRKEALLQSGDTVYVALSGGADSVALLHVMLLLRESLSLAQIMALHVHHGIRGEFADRDEQFVTALCASLGVPLKVEHVDVPTEVQRTGESVEEAARRLRYAFFEAQTKGQPQSKIATAHTASDQAETVLLHLIRGSGMKGVGGIPVRRSNIIRPLLTCTAAEVRSFCEDNGFDYVTDETNGDMCYARNRVRHDILPSMRRINENVDAALVRFSRIASQEDRFLSALAKELLKSARQEEDRYSVEALLQADPVIRNRALCMMCPSEYQHILRLESCLEKGGCVNFPGDYTAVSDGVTLRFVKQIRDVNKTVLPSLVEVIPGIAVSFGDSCYIGRVISYMEYKEKLKIHKKLFDFCISYDMIENDLSLRARQAGDTIRPYGRNCTKTLKKLFNERHIPCEKRDYIPVLINEYNTVLAALGICVDERVAVCEATEHVLWFEEICNNNSSGNRQ